MLTLRQHTASAQIRGFTLVETLVAISIFVVVIVGPISIAAKSMQSAYYASEQVTAIFLAQEALESIRELRDDAGLEAYQSSDPDDNAWVWFSNLPSTCKNAPGCDINRTSISSNPTFVPCTGTNACKLKKTTSQAGPTVYGHSGLDTPFTRKIVVTDEGDAVAVTVTVSWKSNLFNSGDREVVIVSWLYNQYKRYE